MVVNFVFLLRDNAHTLFHETDCLLPLYFPRPTLAVCDLLGSGAQYGISNMNLCNSVHSQCTKQRAAVSLLASP